MRPAVRSDHEPLPRTTTISARRRSADVFAVYDSVEEADAAATLLAGRGIPDARITAVVTSTGRPSTGRVARAREQLMVLLRGRPRDTERAHEILADAAATSAEVPGR